MAVTTRYAQPASTTTVRAHVARVLQRAAPYLAYLYLLRVPILAFAVLLLAASSVVPMSPTNSLLRGVFDLETATWIGSLRAFGLVTLSVLMAATAAAVTARLVLLDGWERFDVPRLRRTEAVELALRLLVLLAAVAVVGAALYETWPALHHPSGAAAGIVLGGAAYWVAMTAAHRLLWRHVFVTAHRPAAAPVRCVAALARGAQHAVRWAVRVSPKGFTITEGAMAGWLKPDHAFAVHQFVISLLLWAGLFVSKRRTSFWHGRVPFEAATPLADPTIPTLCLLMVLVMLACWVAGGLAFFFDRFRVPVILLAVAYGWVVGLFPQADYFYAARLPAQGIVIPPARPSAIAAAPDGGAIVVVAAAGGGIQASAWTARVIVGLQQDLATDHVDFSRAVRLLSGVSGGSVGALFVAGGYGDDGSLGAVASGDDTLDHHPIVLDAEASGLDDVAWGLAFPDLFWSALPGLKGLYLWWPPSLFGGPNLTSDRGLALEDGWRARFPKDRRGTLHGWRADALAGRRPGVFFNAAMVESGGRLILGTVDLDESVDGGAPTFAHRYPGLDLDVTTAARLSATFPYVTPATRLLRPDDADDVFKPQEHVVDGGYYDNYGIVSLTEWLRTLWSEGARPSRIVLLQVRAFPDEQPGLRGEHGWLFQTAHPLETLYDVRGNGQLANADLNLQLLRDLWGDVLVPVELVASYSSPDFKPPLSWHLTWRDRKELRAAWEHASQPRRCIRDLMQPGSASAASIPESCAAVR